MNRLDDSITDLKKAVEIEPRNPSAHNNLGLSYFELAVHDEAIKCFTEGMFVFFCMYLIFFVFFVFFFPLKCSRHPLLSSLLPVPHPIPLPAIAIDDTNSTFYNNRGLALYHHNDLEAALSDMNEAVSRDSSKNPDPNFYFNRGNTRLARHEPKKALSDFGEALRLNGSDAKYLHSLGLARQQIEGEEELALSQFKKALEVDPTHVPSRYHCGSVKIIIIIIFLLLLHLLCYYYCFAVCVLTSL